MKVAIFTESYRPVVNGVARSVETLVGSLHERGHQAIVYAPAAPRGAEPFPFERRFPAYHLPMAPDYPLAIPFSPGLAREFAAMQFDLVHVQTPFALGVCGMALAYRHRIPVLAHMHTLYEEYAHYVPLPRPLARWLIRGIVHLFYNRARAVIAPSPPIRQLLLEYGIRRPIHVVPTGVRITPPGDRQEARSAFQLPANAPLLLYTGRIAPEKNVSLLLQSFALVRQSLPDARLLLLGDGPGRADAERLCVSLGVEGSVTFAGLRPPADVKLACSAADLYLFPSVTDTQALSVVEAMACAVPPVVVDAYGPADVVQNHISGRVVPPTPKSMADVVVELIRNPGERARLGEGALRRAQEYSSDAMIERLLEIYRDLARGQTAAV
ncbi:MAG: glycosyltransferase [Chloroflexi bacterium]|nr:glycosyltransferase [Chloroflexota bacterium]